MRAVAKRVLFAVVCAALGAGGVRAGDEKPATKEQADDAAWLPPITTFLPDLHGVRKHMRLAPSTFPELHIPEPKAGDFDGWRKRVVDMEKRCARLNGKIPLKIESTDDGLQKLLKLRLHQLTLEYRHQEQRKLIDIGGPDPRTPGCESDQLLRTQGAITELWAGQLKERIPWFEELVIVAKEVERYIFLRVEAGALKPQEMALATRARLQLELALWYAKDPKAEPIKAQPVKEAERPSPVEGNWLADKKVPPTLFPDIVPPVVAGGLRDSGWSSFAFARRMARYTDRCPRLFGVVALKIEPTDGTARKLLKARLHQGTLQFQLPQWEQHFGPDPNSFVLDANCLLDIQAAATELWAEQPKELIPWLEELLVAAKDQEQYTQRRVEGGAYKLQLLNYATQTRLKIEMGLWKAKNPK